MGKKLHHQESGLSIGNHSPGCMGGILHHFHNHKRLHVMKKLPQRSHGAGKRSTVIADAESSTKSTPETAEIQENGVSHSAETKEIEVAGSLHKSSIKSRIKAMITEEMSKRKGRHRRTASCPVRTQLEHTDSIHRIHPSDLDPSMDTHSDNNIFHDPINSVALLERSRSNGMGWLPVRDHILLQDEYIYAIEPSKRASLQESKLFLDALDLLNMRKEVFLKILKDSNSSLAQNRRPPKCMFGLTKSVSFPASGSSERGASKISTKDPFTENTSSEHSSPTSANMLRKRRDNKAALRRFKNLTEKIKHVIRYRKKEKHMIVMDGVLHKIPYGRQANSKHIKPDKFDCAKSPVHHLKRTFSFNDSFDRYDRLIDTDNNNRDMKEQKFRTTNSSPIHSPAILKRIVSLPDLRSHSYYQIDDSSTLAESKNRRLHENKLSSVGSENKLCSLSENGSQENYVDVGESFDESSDSRTTKDNSSCHDLNFEPGPFPASQPSKLEMIPENDFDHLGNIHDGVHVLEDDNSSTNKQESKDMDSCNESESTTDEDSLETQVKQFYNELFQVQVDIKNKSEYNYVKDVLELSGFSREEILGQWYSAEHPVDPQVFDEVETEPDCSGNKGRGSWDHLMLFDLINEVLMSIYERSFCYWPMPLTCQSRMHRMPKGSHVLEEVWDDISWFLRWRPEKDESIDDAVSRDLGKGDGWMNLQLDAECVGIEVEDLIFDDLLQEILSN